MVSEKEKNRYNVYPGNALGQPQFLATVQIAASPKPAGVFC